MENFSSSQTLLKLPDGRDASPPGSTTVSIAVDRFSLIYFV